MAKSEPANSTVKLEDDFRERIALAMKASGTKIKSDVYRAALMKYCREVEADLRQKNPQEYEAIYGEFMKRFSTGSSKTRS